MTEPVILTDLDARGLVHDHTDRAELAALLAAGPVTLYWGVDPTADSMHVGHFVGLLALRRFQLAGNRPIALAGGATGMIGDPSGRSDERNLLDEDTLAANLAGITAQLERFLDFEAGPYAAELVDNRAWTSPLTLIEFLRGVGKYFTVNQMVAKESVRNRLASNNGLSFTEFSYMLLQANDYAWLAENRGCRLQIGGSDQWGNITAGIDLVRRRGLGAAHGLTFPLMTRADGAKFGKTAEGAVWLSPDRTSPFAFFQYFVQADDRDMAKFLHQLTFLPAEEIAAILADHHSAPERRGAQRRLAEEVTTLVHGAAACAAAAEATDVAFGRADGGAIPSAEAFATLEGEIPTVELPHGVLGRGISLVDLLVDAGAAASKSDARRTIDQQGYVMNGTRPASSEAVVDTTHLAHDRYLLIKRGKKQVFLVVAR